MLEWNHLKEIGVRNLWFGVLLVDDSEPHNDRHHSGQKQKNYENTGKSNAKLICEK